MIRRPPRSTLFPSTTLSRSAQADAPPITATLAAFVATHPSRGWSDAAEHEARSVEHTSELQSPCNLVCRLLLEQKRANHTGITSDCPSAPLVASLALRQPCL